jgi:hypothetical protein
MHWICHNFKEEMYMQIISELTVKNSGTLYITIQDNSQNENMIKTFVLAFCGWRIKNSTGEIMTAIFNDPEQDDIIYCQLIGKEIKKIWYDKYDLRIETVNNEIIESFGLHNDLENKGFYIIDEKV